MSAAVGHFAGLSAARGELVQCALLISDVASEKKNTFCEYSCESCVSIMPVCSLTALLLHFFDSKSLKEIS